MPALGEVPRSDDNAPIVKVMYDFIFEGRDPIEDRGTSTGTSGDWWTVFANSPNVLKHCVDGFALYRNPENAIDPVLRELGQARAGWSIGSQFVFSQHCKSLRGLGVDDERIAAVAYWEAADCFNEVERLLLAYTDHLAVHGGRVPDQLMAKLREHLDDRAILEFTYITSLYVMHGIMSKALRTEWDDVDDRITEIHVDGADDELITLAAEE